MRKELRRRGGGAGGLAAGGGEELCSRRSPLQPSALALSACVQQNMKQDRRQKDGETGPAALLRFIPSELRATVACPDETHTGWWNRHTLKKNHPLSPEGLRKVDRNR